jgi:hypothetical protein
MRNSIGGPLDQIADSAILSKVPCVQSDNSFLRAVGPLLHSSDGWAQMNVSAHVPIASRRL